MIKVIQMGLGPLGQTITRFIGERDSIEIIGAVDKDPALIGKDLGQVSCGVSSGIRVAGTVADTGDPASADAAILATVSSMKTLSPQIEELLELGLNVVSTCEELSYPWDTAPQEAEKLDRLAKEKGVTVLGTGVNPGFLMDALPSFLTAVCQRVDSVQVKRYQNAALRRIPFQRKIGAGLTLEEFEQKRRAGTLRHVGLTESMRFIAHQLGWVVDSTEEIIEPVIAQERIDAEGVQITNGMAAGVRQVGNGFVSGDKKIELVFQAAVGQPESYDEVVIVGHPTIRSRIVGGVNGDVATCAITLNALRSAVQADPGLQTMATVPMVCFS